MHHQQGCRDPFAGHIADCKKEALVITGGFALEAYLTVVSSHGAYRLVAILCLPPFEGEVSRRQKLELNLCCQIKVLLMLCPFLIVQVIETEPAERIKLQAILFDGVIAGLTEAITSDLDLCEGSVYFRKKVFEVIVRDRS
jgi:hypothetical protein